MKLLTSDGDYRFKHGHTKGGISTRTYRIWRGMRYRCKHENCPEYANYGGRGISICERWEDFRNFLKDMGESPSGMSIDRINNNGNYEPGNCRWATSKEQSANKRPRVFMHYSRVRTNNRHGFTGIRQTSSGSFEASGGNRPRVFLGVYEKKEDAIKARMAWEKEQDIIREKGTQK